MRIRTLIGISSASVALVGAGTLAMAWATESARPKPSPPPHVVAWLQKNAVPFDSVVASDSPDDLVPLRAMVGDARIVALGEPTHGTREAFQMKHRLLEFLVERMGFTLFSIEASTPEAYRLNDYVLGKDDSSRTPEQLIRGMYFWTWSTEEVRDMVLWMRQFNLSNASRGDHRRVQFTGFDMQEHRVAIDVVRSFAKRYASDLLAQIEDTSVKLQASHETAMSAYSRGGFGVATSTFPVEQARGKRVTLSGWIRTENLVGGWAGLWWRVDGPSQTMLGFDNMADRGARGTTEWTRYELSMDVPTTAVNINFGAVMPGYGRAWFDDFRIELDGVEYQRDPSFDLTFDGQAIVGFRSGTTSGVAPQSWPYTLTLDQGIKHSGASALRLESTSAAAPDTMAERTTLNAAVDAAQSLHDALVARRPTLVTATSERDVEWAIHNADILGQCARMHASNNFAISSRLRDDSMAANVAWILGQESKLDPNAKIVLWAHNAHVSREPGRMGAFLEQRFPGQMVVFGFTTTSGRYRAIGGGSLTDHPLQVPRQDSLEWHLSSTGQDRLLLDVRAARSDDSGSSWLKAPIEMRGIGAVAMEEQFAPTIVPDRYDVIVHIENTTPARPLPR